MTPSSPNISVNLLCKLRDGDTLAFEEIYKMLAPQLYQRLLRLFKDTTTVEEIVQDTFLKLWEKRQKIDPEQGFKTYVYRIADHLAIDLFRKISRDKALQEELWASTVSFCLQTEETMIGKEQHQLVVQAIQRLSPKRRQVVLMCKLEGRSYQEVADAMGISVSTVSNQLVKAIKEIKRYVLRAGHGEQIVLLYLLSWMIVF